MAAMVMNNSSSDHGNRWTPQLPRTRSAPAHRQVGYIDRPKSTSSSIRPSTSSSHHAQARPHTALGMPSCDRVYQVEHEPTRKQNLESHFPVRRGRPPPWQKQLDGAVNQMVTAPGYILSRSKSKMYMYIKTDDFFSEDMGSRSVKKPDPERDSLISQLQEQIDDLNLFLEEERLNHRDTRRHAAEELQNRIDELTREHDDALKKLAADNADEAEKSRLRHEKELQDHIVMTEQTTAKLQGEVAFLQGAFESYKSQLHADTDSKWRKHEAEIKDAHEEEIKKQLSELRSRIMAERTMERAETSKMHQKELHALRREQKKEKEALIRKYADAAETVKKLHEVETRLESLEAEYDTLKAQYDDVCTQYAEATQELTETKVELLTYEKDFQDRVAEIEGRYHNQIHSLMAQNTELRQQYMKKCGQLFEEQVGSEQTRVEAVRTTKQAMRMLIESRSRADVSLASGDPMLEEEKKEPKQRPLSAPGTKGESRHAVITAGETEEYVEKRQSRPSTCRPRMRHHNANDRA